MRIIVLIILLLSSSCLAAEPQKYILGNGLTIIIKETPGLGLVGISAFVKASALNETKKDAGIAVMAASMLKQGTKTRSAEGLAEELEFCGANMGVETAPDYTAVSYLSRSRDFGLGINMLNDILNNAVFPKDELNKQKDNAISDIEQIKDNPSALAQEELSQLVYKNHPYGIKAEEKIPNIKNFSRADLLKFYSRYYVPSNIIISIAGDIKEKEALQLCQKTFRFGDRGEGKENQDIRISGYPEKLRKNSEKKITKKGLQAAWLDIGYLGVSIAQADYPALKVLSDILGSGMSSRLFTEIREKRGLVYSIGSYFPSNKQKSVFVVYAVASGKNLAKVKKMVFEQVDKIKTQKVSAEELNRAKNYINGKFIIAHQDLIRQAWYPGWLESLGIDCQMDQDYKNMINSVTADDILRVAKKYLIYPKTVILTPKK